MAAAIITKSATLEGQWLEITTALQMKQEEGNNQELDDLVTNLNLDYDTNTGQITGAFNFIKEIDADGHPLPKIIEVYDVAAATP